MSSSLQNIPNGISIYHSSSPYNSSNIGQITSRNNRFLTSSSQPSYQLYDSKSNSNMNQNSLSPVMRESSGYGKKSASPTLMNNSYQNVVLAQKPQFYGSIGKNHNTPPGRSSLTTENSPYGTVAQQHHTSSHNKHSHHNVLTSSDTNLAKLFDRINSSDESVCSSSSRDLNLSSQHHSFQAYGTKDLNKLRASSGSAKNLNIWNDYPLTQTTNNQQQKQQQQQQQQLTQNQQQSSIYNEVLIAAANNNNSGLIPKKQQRGHKDKDEIVKAKPYNVQQNW
jgi:hypothetical protein